MTTAGLLYVPLTTPVINNSFQPAVGSTLTVNVAGGGLATLYSDSGLTTPVLNPQTADAAGRFFAQSTTLFADASQSYDAVLAMPDGETITYDNLPLIALGVSTSGFAPLNSPNFTGVPTAPTPSLADNSTKLATTAFVMGQGYAPLNSPALTGVPTVPTATAGTNTTQAASTAFVETAIKATAQTLATNGYVTLPGGLIIQWGKYSSTITGEQAITVTFPIAFPTACLGIVSNGLNTGASVNKDMWTQMESVSTTQGVVYCQGATGVFSLDGFIWIAWGY